MPRAAVDVLERRVRRFELRLFHVLLAVRAGLPTATCLVLVTAAPGGSIAEWGNWIWAALAVWTAATTPFLWSRLAWARRLPLPVRAEMSVLVALVALGCGTRAWHMIHSAVPLAFVSLFVGFRAAVAVGGAVVGALWLARPVLAAWPEAPLEEPLRAIFPSVVLAVLVTLVLHVPRVIGDVDTIVTTQRQAAEALAALRRMLAAQTARLDVHRQVVSELGKVASGLSASARRLVATLPEASRASGEGLLACTTAIDGAIEELSGEQPAAGRAPSSAIAELEAALVRTSVLGKSVSVQRADGLLPLRADEVEPFRRLVTEALANARRHGHEPIEVRIPAGAGRRIEIVNRGRAVPAERPGGVGLGAMRADASRLGASIRWTYDPAGRVVVSVDLPPREVDPRPTAAADGHLGLAALLDRRRRTYELTALVARLCFAVLTAVMIQLEPGQHRSLLPALTATSVFLVVWNGALLARNRAVSRLLVRQPRLVWVDGLLMVGLIAFQAGMASPWMPLSMGSILVAGWFAGPRAAVTLACLLSAAMLGGHELMLNLPLDDAGTTDQDMPLGWLLNTFIYLAVAGVASVAGWLVRRVEEAADAYRQTLEEQLATEHEAGLADACAETYRELHASLQQYVGAALVRIGSIRRLSSGVAETAVVEEQLEATRETLGRIMTALRPGPATDAAP